MSYDEKSKERTIRHLKKLKEIRFRVKPAEYEAYEKAANAAGYTSMRKFYLDAINEKIQRMKE